MHVLRIIDASGVGYGPFGAVGDERVESSGIAADAEGTNVLLGVWVGSLASVVEYISGLTAGSWLIPFCPLRKYSGIGAVAEMADGFMGVLSVWGCVFAARVIGATVEFAVFALT